MGEPWDRIKREAAELGENARELTWQCVRLGWPLVDGEDPPIRYRLSRERESPSPRCPVCRSPLAEAPKTALLCLACQWTAPAPSLRLPAPSLPSERSHPCWEADQRLLSGAWDRYARPGSLVRWWGSATARGEADDALDAAIHADAAQTAASAALLKAIRAPKQRTALQRLVLAHCAAAGAAADPLTRRLAGLGQGELARAVVGGLLDGAALLLANVLLRRGVDVYALLGAPDAAPIEPVPLPVPRAERWAGVGHVVAVAASAPLIEPAGLGGALGAARALHALPTGPQFGGRMAVAPSHASGGSAPGVGRVDDMVDAQGALSGLAPADVALLRRAAEGPLPPEARGRLEGARARVRAALRGQGLIPAAKLRQRAAATEG